MARVRDMQGVSAHIEYLKSDGKRRHSARCIFHDGTGKARICTNTQSSIYNRRCGSARCCDYYMEESEVI